MASKLTDSSKFKVTVKSDTDIPALFCFYYLFCSVLFIFFLSYFLSIVVFFLSFFVLFCFFSLIYVHVTVYTY